MDPHNPNDPEEQKLQEMFAERFKQLPEVVQDAITSADLEKRLRALAETNKLHIDQWELLENEVRLTLYGFQPTEALEENIRNEVGVSKEIAADLNANISKLIFEPVRQELERQLEHPEAKAATVSGIETARTEALAGEASAAGTQDAPIPQVVAQTSSETSSANAPAPAPATPPPAPPTAKAQRAPVSPAYKPQTPSHERKDIEGDPYREQTA